MPMGRERPIAMIRCRGFTKQTPSRFSFSATDYTATPRRLWILDPARDTCPRLSAKRRETATLGARIAPCRMQKQP